MTRLQNRTRPAETLASVSSEVDRGAIAKAYLSVWYDWPDNPEEWWSSLSDDERARGLRAADAVLALASTPSQSDVIEKCGEGGLAAQLAEGLREIIGWQHHDEGCDIVWNKGDKCDCGMADATSKAQAALDAFGALASKEGQL